MGNAMSQAVIAEGMKVTLNFELSLSDGAIIDSTFEKQPATFCMGDGSLLPGFEKMLEGLSAGDHQTSTIEPEQGFGSHNSANVHSVPRDRFNKELELQPGLIVSFSDPKNGDMPGVVKELLDDTVIVDFNHPLAGRDIQFRVEIIEVNRVEQSESGAAQSESEAG